MPPEAELDSDPELTDYLGVVKRQWTTIVGSIALGLGVAAALLLVLPKTYLATASVYVSPLPGQGDTPVSNSRVVDGVNLDTEAQLLTSSVVIDQARSSLGTTDSIITLERRVSVTVPPNSAVLDIGYSAHSSEAAAAGADAFAKAYLANRKDTAESGQAALVSALRKQLKQAATALRDLAKQLDEVSSNSAQRDLLLAQQNVLSLQITNLNERLVTAEAGDPYPGRLITPARTPESADTPKPVLLLPAGALLGLLLGVTIAVFRDRRPRHLKRAGDVERLLSVSLLAEVDHPGAASPTSATEYQQLCHELLATMGRGQWSILGAGVTADDPGAAVTERLALTLARLGGQVTLVPGANEPRPRDDDGSSPQQVASDVPGSVRRFSVDDRAPLAEQLRTARPADVLDELMATSELMVVSTRPVMSSPDAQSVAPLVGGVLLIVQLKRSRTRVVRDAIHRLQRGNAHVLGVVVVKPAPRRSRRLEQLDRQPPVPEGGRREQRADDVGADAQARSSAS